MELFIGLILLALTLMITGYVLKKMALAFAAGGAWMLLGAFCYTNAVIDYTDIYFELFCFCCVLAITSFLETLGMREKKEPEEDDGLDDEEREFKRESEEFDAEYSKLDFLYGGGSRYPRRHMPRRLPSDRRR